MVFIFKLIDTLADWVAALAVAPSPEVDRRRHQQTLATLLYSFDSIGRKAQPLAAALLKIVQEAIPSDGPPVLAIDDTPTQRYGKAPLSLARCTIKARAPGCRR